MNHLLAADPTSVTLIANLKIRGVWQPQADVLMSYLMYELFIFSDAPSYCGRSPQTVLCSTEGE